MRLGYDFFATSIKLSNIFVQATLQEIFDKSFYLLLPGTVPAWETKIRRNNFREILDGM